MHRITLEVEQRNQTGKGPARRLRAAGKVPAIFYGKRTQPLNLAVNIHQFKKVMEDAASNPIFELKIESNGTTTTRRAILKDRQIRPVDGSLMHLDFLEIFMDEAIEVAVEIEFEGKPIGVEKGGTLQPVTKELMISCLPDNIPDKIVVDVSRLDIGHSIHLGDITLPEGVSAVQDPSLALVTILAPEKEAEVAEESESETSS